MFKSYFFIPANKQRFLEKAQILQNIDYRVFDLEDSVLTSDLEVSVKLLSTIEIKKSDWLRIPVIKNEMKEIILKAMEIGLNNYVIPKFEGFDEIRKIIQDILSVNAKAKFILLLENSKSYIELEKILAEFNNYIHGISLGIHDFTFATGMENDYKFLRNIRINIMLLAKAYSVEPIDVVSTDLKYEENLKFEIMDGFRAGYRAKFLIHPFQLNVLNSVSYYTKEEIIDYKQVMKYFHKNIEGKEALFTYNGRAYEKMHIKEIEKIIHWGNNHYGTIRETF